MFLPIGDTPNPPRFSPYINYGLIAVNVVVFVVVTLPLSAQGVDPDDPALHLYLEQILKSVPGLSERQLLAGTSAYDLFTFNHGYKPGAASLADLFFSMFLHGGFMHLAGNMLFLWIFGDNVEHRVGRLKYLVIYLVSGVFATWAFALFAGDSMVPLVGASGAISGVLGLYFLMFPRNKVKVFAALFPFFFDVLLIPCRIVLGFYLVFQNLFPFLFGASTGVAHGAHIGGFIAGLGLAYVGERFSWRWPYSDSYYRPRGIKTAVAPHETDTGAAASAGQALADLRSALASPGSGGSRVRETLSRVDAQDLDTLTSQECIALAGWMFEGGHPIAASELLRRSIGRFRESQSELARLYLALGTLRLRQNQHARAYQHFLDVLDLEADDRTAATARHALQQINPDATRRS